MGLFIIPPLKSEDIISFLESLNNCTRGKITVYKNKCDETDNIIPSNIKCDNIKYVYKYDIRDTLYNDFVDFVKGCYSLVSETRKPLMSNKQVIHDSNGTPIMINKYNIDSINLVVELSNNESLKIDISTTDITMDKIYLNDPMFVTIYNKLVETFGENVVIFNNNTNSYNKN